MKTFSLILAIILFSFIVSAQRGVMQKEINKDGSVAFIEFRTDSVPKLLSNARQVLQETLKMQAYDDLQLSDTKTDQLGFTHQYYQQFYKGVRVAYSAYSVHGKNNMIHTINGSFSNVKDVTTIPSLTIKDALASAMKFINASVYKWEVPEEEQWLKENFNESYYPKGELVIVKDRLKTNERFRLAWKFDIYAHIPMSRDYIYIYVDAITAEIIDKDSRIHHTNSNGTADTRYSGTRNIVTDSFTGGFRLRETRNSVRIETRNMKNQGANYAAAPDFADNDNAWTNAEFNNVNFDNAALDAHWGAEMVYDYWRTIHNRNSWDGAGGPLLNYVHADLVAQGYINNDNAFWDGQRMTYADGATCFRPLTSLDVCAHEIGHGINSTTARLKYEGESGALNEALSDIWAACVEQWAAPPSANDPDKNPWLIGEEIDICSDALRSMGNPNAHNQPDTYLATNAFWVNTTGCSPSSSNDYCGVHTNSGVINYWFFLVTNGGTGTNDLNNVFTVNGIGINSSARIVYNTESIQLAASNEQIVTFSQFRTASIASARNLFGVNSCEEIAVTNAWFAVGVGAPYSNTLNIAGTEPVCTTSIFSITNLPAWFAVNSWVSSNPNGLSINATSGVATRVNNYNGRVNVTVTLNGGGGCTTNMTRSIIVGTGIADPLFEQKTVACVSGNSYSILARVTQAPGSATYKWYIGSSSGTNFILKNTTTSNSATVGGGIIDNLIHILRVDITNICNLPPVSTANPEGRFAASCSGGGGGGTLTIYPNPASTELNVEFIHDATASSAVSTQRAETAGTIAGSIEFSVKLVNANNQTVTSGNSQRGKISLDSHNLQPGLYYLHIYKDGETITEQILIKK